MPYSVSRYHDFSAGHRVVGHESKCAFLHGHNYRITFVARPDNVNTTLSVPGQPDRQTQGLDEVGRVIDFACLKSTLCQWLEDNWDHKMLLWREDPLYTQFAGADGFGQLFFDGIVPVPFNPTAENMAQHLVTVVAPPLLKPYGVTLYICKVEETRKCSAIYTLG